MERPKSAVVFGIVNILLGMLGVLAIAGNIVVRFELVRIPPGSYPVQELMQINHAYRWFMDISAVTDSVATVLLISAGIGLLILKPWS